LIKLYKEEFNKFKDRYKIPFIIGLSIVLIISVLVFFVLIHYHQIAEQATKEVIDSMKKKGIPEPEKDNNNAVFWGILLNNLGVTLLTVSLGIVPFIIFPVIVPFATCVAVSVLLAFAHIKGMDAFSLFVRGILPHGVTELTAMFYAMSIGFYVSFKTTSKIFSSNRKNIMWRKEVISGLKSYFVFVVPLILLSAIIEAYITPLLLK
jgi:stage II sporulation protein M